jgi:transcriptional regulator with XRE-family HTH domain
LNEKENKWEEIDRSSLLDFVYEIKKRRLQLRITQKSLAKKMGTTQAIISKFEKGNYNPTFMFLQRLAEVLGGKIKLFLEVNDEKIKKDSNFNNEDNFEEIFRQKLEE